jgi:hypothetical protein
MTVTPLVVVIKEPPVGVIVSVTVTQEGVAPDVVAIGAHVVDVVVMGGNREKVV